MHTADALNGMKIRTPSRTGSWMLEAMGATPIGAPVSSIPEMLSKKVVDGVTIPFEIALPLKVHEMVEYHTVLDDPKYPRPNTAVFLFAMNKERYNSLPADLKKVIDNNAGRNIAKWAGQIWIDVEKPGEEAALKSGEIFKLPPAEVAKLRKMIEKPVHDRWIEDVKSKGMDGAALIQEARGLIDKYTH
jgi:TRAP-type C4-dicarboxylate transport system substrate-binding protein